MYSAANKIWVRVLTLVDVAKSYDMYVRENGTFLPDGDGRDSTWALLSFKRAIGLAMI